MGNKRTIVLSDCPECLEGWFPGGLEWRRLEWGGSHGKTEVWDERVARLLDEGRPWWRGMPVEMTSALTFWDYLVVVQDAARSQFDILCEGAGQDEFPEGCTVACLALEGRGFHGLRERPWVAHRGNLHLSAFIGCRLNVQEMGLGFSMLPTVAVLDALWCLAGSLSMDVPMGIRWVNDVFWNGRKLGGVLTQTQVQGVELTGVILGIGLNVAVAPEVPPSLFVPGVVCWSEVMQGEPVELGQVTFGVLNALGTRLEQVMGGGVEEVWRTYLEHSLVLGKRVRIFLEGDSGENPDSFWKEGIVSSMDPDLGLRLEGDCEVVRRGRLVLVVGEMLGFP